MRSETAAVLALLAAACGGREPVDGGRADAGPSGTPHVLAEIALFSGAKALRITEPERCEDASTASLVFQWKFDGEAGAQEDRVFAAVFTEPPVAAAQIKNADKAVWWWSTGWKNESGKGLDGRVAFSEGRATGSGGTPDASKPPDAARLPNGQWRWFAVWAWNAEFKVVKASEARAFCPGGGCPCGEDVDGSPLNERYCLALPGPPIALAAKCRPQ